MADKTINVLVHRYPDAADEIIVSGLPGGYKLREIYLDDGAGWDCSPRNESEAESAYERALGARDEVADLPESDPVREYAESWAASTEEASAEHLSKAQMRLIRMHYKADKRSVRKEV